ncbi:MAG: NAD(P)-dependent oxidoreductase [Planctomycetota bacterium]
MTRPTVVLLEPLHADARSELAAATDVVEAPSPDADLEGLAHVAAIITRGRGRVDAALLERCPALRAVARAGVGLDNVDRAAAAARDVVVLNVPDALTDTVAEHALALALAGRRRAFEGALDAREGRWEKRLDYAGETLASARATVVGLGAIGARTAALLRAVGADVTTWNRSARDDEAFEPDLDRALEGAEVVSLHVALTDATRGMIDGERIGRLAEGATLVNTARPAVCDRDAVLAGLADGHLGAYAVDGFEPEPPATDDPLLRHDRVLVTPHVAALTRSTFRGLCLSTVRGVLDVLDGRAPKDGARVVPPSP